MAKDTELKLTVTTVLIKQFALKINKWTLLKVKLSNMNFITYKCTLNAFEMSLDIDDDPQVTVSISTCQ